MLPLDVTPAQQARHDGLLRALSEPQRAGLVTGPTGVSWHEFATAIWTGAKARGLPMKATAIEAIATSAYPTPAARPAWSVLDCSRCETLTGVLPSWTTTLDAYLDLQKRS